MCGVDRARVLLCQVDSLELTAVNRIFQGEGGNAVIVAGIKFQFHFFDVAGVVVAAGLDDFEFRLAVFSQANEIIVADAHVLAANDGGDVVLAFFYHREFGRGLVTV